MAVMYRWSVIEVSNQRKERRFRFIFGSRIYIYRRDVNATHRVCIHNWHIVLEMGADQTYHILTPRPQYHHTNLMMFPILKHRCNNLNLGILPTGDVYSSSWSLPPIEWFNPPAFLEMWLDLFEMDASIWSNVFWMPAGFWFHCGMDALWSHGAIITTFNLIHIYLLSKHVIIWSMSGLWQGHWSTSSKGQSSPAQAISSQVHTP